MKLNLPVKINKKFINIIGKHGRNIADQRNLYSLASYNAKLISDDKAKYFHNLGEKLTDSLIGTKTYWSILNKFMHKNKIPFIPPILIYNKFITEVPNKSHLFNNFFSNQCTVINNTTTLPDFILKTNHKLSKVNFSENEILSIIRALNVNKDHGCDNISIRMIKICDEVISPPLLIIFETALRTGIYPNLWKKSNVIPIHKKDSKNLLKNYRPIISLLPICGKIFEKCIYNATILIFITIIYSLHISLVFVNKILAYPSFLLSLAKSLIKHLVFFLVSLRHLTGFGMKVCCSNSNLMAYKGLY